MNEKTIKSRTVFKGRLLNVDVVDVELEPGRRSTREIVRHPGAVAVLAQRMDGRFVFVKQYRKAAEKKLFEVVAGGLEPREKPRDCAIRELEEETGHKTSRLVNLGYAYPAPGYTDESLHLFYARLKDGKGNCNPDSDERLEVVYLSEQQVDRMIRQRRIHDAKTLAVWLLWKEERRKS